MAPSAELGDHLRECRSCGERWEDEQNLSAHFQAVRNYAGGLRQPEARREQILGEFAGARRSSHHTSLKWALSAAAILILAVSLGVAWRNGRPSSKSRAESTQIARASVQDSLRASVGHAEDSSVEELSDESGFVAVPYVAPLAPGEFVKVVRVELHPVALAHMGIYVDSDSASGIPAEVLIGEDGFPRAVRVFEEIQF